MLCVQWGGGHREGKRGDGHRSDARFDGVDKL